ncbi:MAG: cytochrome c3 family protein [Planctomycetota bacterium]
MASQGRMLPLLALLGAPLAVVLGLTLGHDPVAYEASRPLIHREDGFVGSERCRQCHLEQHASWSRTWHRTMTQRPGPDTVVGAFDGRPVRFYGREFVPRREGDRFLLELDDGEGRRVAEVALVTGSHRYQQYHEELRRGDGVVYRRLPLLWHRLERRWMHLNDVFLSPDSDGVREHAALWNENCIFCHTTAPRPGFLHYGSHPANDAKTFDSETAELGIACEACHGPGRRHAEAMTDPLARYEAHLGEAGDLAIVHPDHLDKARAAAVCGQCHGQRLPRELAQVEAWLTKGPEYRSGDRLEDHVAPLALGTTVPGPGGRGTERPFDLRFWADGTARLSAYEYQGLTQSPCYQRGEMHCGSCHRMHSGEPAGMLPHAMKGDAACLQCHADIGRDVSAHTRHAADGPGSRCLDCHMPRMVYGILEVHRSHRVEVPDPARAAELGRPDACTLCHLDKSPVWCAEELARLWGREPRLPARRADGAPLGLSGFVASLHAGDAVQRVVYAAAAGRPGVALAPEDKGFVRVHLMAMLNDAYPSLRRMALRSLRALEAELPVGLDEDLSAFDPTWREAGEAARMARLRRESLGMIRTLVGRAPGRLRPPPPGLLVGADLAPDLPAIIELLKLQSHKVIAIGE